MRNAETTRKYREFKENAECIICGETAPFVLEFHHVDPATKTGNVSRMVKDGYSWDVVLAEIKKCVVVCGNDHRKIHAGWIENPKL